MRELTAAAIGAVAAVAAIFLGGSLLKELSATPPKVIAEEEVEKLFAFVYAKSGSDITDEEEGKALKIIDDCKREARKSINDEEPPYDRISTYWITLSYCIQDREAEIPGLMIAVRLNAS